MNQESYEIFNAVFLYTISAMISIAINVAFYLRARHSKLLSAFLNVQLAVIVWLISKVFKKVATDNDVVWLMVVVQYLALCFFGTVFLRFAYLYRMGKELPEWISKVLFGFSLINYVVVFTNPLHQLFFKSVTVFENIYGPWFYVHTVFSYILIAFSYYYLINALLKNSFSVPMIQALLFNIGLLVPIVSNVVYIFNVVDFSFDITPITFNLTILIFGYSAYRYRFLDIRRVTRNMVLENIHEAIIIIDNEMRVIEQNSAVNELFGYNSEMHSRIDIIDDYFKAAYASIESFEIMKTKIENCIDNQEERFVTEFLMNVHGVRKAYILKMEKIKERSGDMVGYVFRIIDVSKHKELLYNLEDSNNALSEVNKQLSENISANKQLAIAKERSHLSKEVHDILGHSVTIVISLLEMAKSAIKTDKNLASEKVTQGMEIIRSGLVELKRSMKEHQSEYIDANILCDDLSRLVNDFEKSGVNVDFYYKKTDLKISTDTYDTIYRICQEGMTNALRHGNAKNVTIGLRFVERNIDLFIIDDGKGSENIVPGNGLAGMETRVKALSGYFSYGSPDGQGFNIHVTVPFHV